MSVKTEKHEFALFIELLSSLVRCVQPGETFTLSDEKVVRRIMTVLRLSVFDGCVLFDRQLYVHCVIIKFVGKKQIQVKLESKHATTVLKPHITFLLPVLKRDDYESALYSLAEIGVNTIQLIFTKKTWGSSFNERDYDRAQRILIAAAEQSKNYCFPVLQSPVSLEVALNTMDKKSTKIFFDPLGMECFSVMSQLNKNCAENIVLLIGPEGDLSCAEKEIIKKDGFIFCALTPTVVRATQAAALGAGLIRSLIVSSSV